MWGLLIIESPIEKIQFFIKEFEEMKNRWIMCPCCKGKTRIKIREDTELYKFPLFCPKCKREQIINVQQLKVTVITEPDA
jgi:hypothetical protein